MRRLARAFAASLLLLGAADVQALDLNRPPFQAPVGPIEPGILDPVDQCLRFPQLCNPGDPPPDPCLENPELCEPPDPCELNPDLCEPDVCDVSPVLCEDPPILEPEEPAARHLGGNVILRVGGAKFDLGFGVDLSLDDVTFSMLIDGAELVTGRVVPKGKSGRKFTLFLDKPSSDAFTALVAARGGAVASQPEGTVLGDTTKIVLKLDAEGNATLKIKSQVLTSGVGEVVFKALVVEGQANS
jgi:hypothetical protein